ASAAWSQLGNGEYDHDPGNSAEHHQTGRAQMTAWAFDKHQGREVLWVGSSHGGLWKSTVNSTGTVTGFQVLTDNVPGSHTLASFLVHTVDSDKVLISTGTSWGDGDGVHATSNGGASW